PGSNTLTFGMLGCDFHCGYCFTGDTRVVTSKGVLPLQEVFALGERVQRTPDAEISFPVALKAIAASGTWREVRGVFKHHYAGKLMVIRPFYLPALRCTPEHRVYATLDPNGKHIEPITACALTPAHYLLTPKKISHYQSEGQLSLRGRCVPEAIFSNAMKLQYVEEDCFAKGARNDNESTALSEATALNLEQYDLVPLREISTEEFDGDVYNMEVDEEHNYLANFFLVKNCQNWLTSQTLRDPHAGIEPQLVTAEQMVTLGKRYGAKLVGSSYNEPLITSEWGVEVFKVAKQNGLRCVYISNGNTTPEVLEYIRPYVDGYKIDLKTMNDKNYRKLGGVLQNVLDSIKRVYEMGFWHEIVTLIVPGFNDSTEELMDAAQYIRSVSPDIPWHVTAYHQDYNMTDHDNTTAQTLIRAAEIGLEAGLHFVYAGNLPGRVGPYENTYCPKCNSPLIERYGYHISQDKLSGRGVCPKCGEEIPGIWK
ncbi:MAG: hypothetical protein A2Z03_09460, partial [Chloroflexi bacterium RBG_16_56_8]